MRARLQQPAPFFPSNGDTVMHVPEDVLKRALRLLRREGRDEKNLHELAVACLVVKGDAKFKFRRGIRIKIWAYDKDGVDTYCLG